MFCKGCDRAFVVFKCLPLNRYPIKNQWYTMIYYGTLDIIIMLDNILDSILWYGCNMLDGIVWYTSVHLSSRGSCGRGTGSRGQDCPAL